MKRLLFLISVMILLLSEVNAQVDYLVNTVKPVKSYMYEAYRYGGTNSKKMNLSGGLKWQGGFTIGSSQGPYKPGYATFRLGGKYENIMFVLGRIYDPESLDYEPAVVTVYADGKKIMDEIVRRYDVPRRMKLNIKGVDELNFVIVKGEDRIAFAEATLWKSGQTPKETGNLMVKATKPIQLVKDLRPYAHVNHYCISPDDEYKTVFVNANKYHYGFICKMTMALIGVQSGSSYFNLRGQYETLSLLAGPVNNDKSSGGKGWITIKADGKIIHEYEISQDDIAKRIVLNVKGCQQLSFHTEQSNQSMYAAIVDATLYPEGTYKSEGESQAEDINPRLKTLPDVCKLISNIPPYAVGGQIEHQVYDGSSDHITFSMGGTRFSEGFILYEKADFWNDNIISYAVFDLGREFDYVSFTAGYVGKSWNMTNDVIRVYADDEMVLQAPMKATYPNQHFVIPIKKCRKLRFENGGSGNLNVGAYGIADIVVYRGEPVENDLFVHPKPSCPDEIDLIDLGAPYIHYVSTKADSKDEIFYDGTTQRRYFQMPDGTRINKGFMLQTSVHFSLDHGVLASGTDNATSGIIGSAAVGSAFVSAGAAVGGAIVGSTLIGAAALLVLAAGGNAIENSCAAFNTYGEYNSLTFTVACLRPFTENKSDYKETLLIGADQMVVAELTVYETMEPQTVTVPINGCEQLMFWLANTNNTSGQFVFYDIKLTKDVLQLDIPKAARLSQGVVTSPVYTEKSMAVKWKRPAFSGSQKVDAYISDCTYAYNETLKLIEDTKPFYKIHTHYLETSSGDVCKAVSIIIDDPERINNGDYLDFVREFDACAEELKRLNTINGKLIDLSVGYVNANLGLPELGFKAISYGKILKAGRETVKECKVLVEMMIAEKQAEIAFLEACLRSTREIDGVSSTRYTMICPLFEGETPPSDMLQLLSKFNVK